MQRDEEKNLQSHSLNMTHSSNLKNALSIWPRLNALGKKFLSETHMIMAIRSETDKDVSPTAMYKDIFFIVKKDGNVYNYGCKHKHGISIKKNDYLSLSETMNTISDSTGINIIENLCGKNIKTFIQKDIYGLFALTNEGKVYSWGDNSNYTLGHKESKIISEPTLMISLRNENIVNIVCGINHVLALTLDGKVYTWGKNILGCTGDSIIKWQTPKQVKSKLENKKIVCIACGSSYSLVVTDNGEVYSWGSMFNSGNTEQQYLNNDVDGTSYSEFSINRITFPTSIVKVACGFNHALALTDQGNLYVWGKNDYGQLGTVNRIDVRDPVLLDTSKIGKLSDIGSLNMKNISVTINKDGCLYVWGYYACWRILAPLPTLYTNMYDLFASENIMYKPLILSDDEYANQEWNIMRCLKDAFDDPLTSDFKVQVEERDIHVHKAVLKICSSYFRTMFEHNWTENTENVLKIEMFSYNVYKTYLQYLYTGVIDLSPKEALDLLKLADMYNETNLKTDCIPITQRGVTISNVALFYSKAIEYNETRLEEFCFSFALKCMTKVVQTDSFIMLDENTKTVFITKAAEANAFKT